MTKDEEVAGIKAALSSLISAIMDHREERKEFKGEWLTADFDVAADLAKTAAQSSVEEIVEDPVGVSLRRSVEEIGQRLFELGGLKLMQDVADDVANEDEPNYGRRVDIMDKRWDGIGETNQATGAFLGWIA